MAEFARGLRELRNSAGDPTFVQLAKRTGYSKTTLSEALSGRGRPSRDVVLALVASLGGDPTEWDARWLSLPAPPPDPAAEPGLATAAGSAPASARPLAVADSDPLVEDSPDTAGQGRRRALILAVLVVIAGLGVAAYALLSAGDPENDGSSVGASSVTVTVQNLVTAGPDSMREDSPAYLSTLAENNCRARGCAVEGRTLHSGDTLKISCQLTGERTTNGNDGDPADDRNPELFTSTRWYGSTLPDGGIGYIAETWLSPADRGGLELPRCA